MSKRKFSEENYSSSDQQTTHDQIQEQIQSLITYLQNNINPNYLFGREEQIRSIIRFIDSHRYAPKGGCLLIQGLPGTGKTACVESILRSYDWGESAPYILYFNAMVYASKPSSFYKACWRKLEEILHLEVQSSSFVSSMLAMSFLHNDPNDTHKDEKDSDRIPRANARTVHEYFTLLEQFVTKFPSKKDPLIFLIVDEIDGLESVLHQLITWSSEKTRLLFLGITNSIRITNEQEVKPKEDFAKSCIWKVIFPPYSHEELYLGIAQRMLAWQMSSSPKKQKTEWATFLQSSFDSIYVGKDTEKPAFNFSGIPNHSSLSSSSSTASEQKHCNPEIFRPLLLQSPLPFAHNDAIQFLCRRMEKVGSGDIRKTLSILHTAFQQFLSDVQTAQPATSTTTTTSSQMPMLGLSDVQNLVREKKTTSSSPSFFSSSHTLVIQTLPSAPKLLLCVCAIIKHHLPQSLYKRDLWWFLQQLIHNHDFLYECSPTVFSEYLAVLEMSSLIQQKDCNIHARPHKRKVLCSAEIEIVVSVTLNELEVVLEQDEFYRIFLSDRRKRPWKCIREKLEVQEQ